MAAVELLVAHALWLYRPDFLDGFVEAADGLAWVDWAGAAAALDAGRLGCFRGEGTVPRVATSLAAGVPIDLSAVRGLDGHARGLVARAVLAAGGGVAGTEAGR